METIVVKIENTYLSLAHVKKSGSGYRIMRTMHEPLPESLLGDEAGKQPDLVAAVIASAVESGKFPIKNLSVYLGGGTELFTEYRFNEALDQPTQRQLRQKTEAALLNEASAPLYRVKHYPYDGEDNGLKASAIFAADPDFCDRLKSTLEKEGFTVAIISSSLAAFAETAKTVSSLGDRVLVLAAEAKELQAALFVSGRLVRLARFTQGAASDSSVLQLLPYIDKETKIALCGQESQNAHYRELLKRAGAQAVGAVNAKMKDLSERFVLSDELAYKNDVFPIVFAATAFSGAEGETAYFAEARDTKKFSSGLRVACIVTIIVAVFMCALSPVTYYLSERDLAANRARLENPFYASAAIKLEQYRNLVAEYTELSAAEEEVPARDLSHASLLEETIYSLLPNTKIEEMYFEKGKGILIDFTTMDVEIFEALKDRMISKGEVLLYEARAREQIDEYEWRLQIRVTLAQTAWEDRPND